MILILSETDQILGADEEFLKGDSLENLKTSFPSMTIFSLQSETNNFKFDLSITCTRGNRR